MPYSRAPVEITLSDTFEDMRREVNASFARLNELFNGNGEQFSPLSGSFIQDSNIFSSTIDESVINDSQVNKTTIDDSKVQNSEIDNVEITNSEYSDGVIKNTEIQDTVTFSGVHSLKNVTFKESTFQDVKVDGVEIVGYTVKVDRNVVSHNQGSTTLEISTILPDATRRAVFNYESYVIRVIDIDGTTLTLNEEDVPNDLTISGEITLLTNYTDIVGFVFTGDSYFVDKAFFKADADFEGEVDFINENLPRHQGDNLSTEPYVDDAEERVQTNLDNHTETDLVDGVHGTKLVKDLSEVADDYEKISTNETVKTYVDNHTDTNLTDGVHGAKLVEDLSEEADEYQKISTNETIKTYVDNVDNQIQTSLDNHTDTNLTDGVHGAKLVEDLSEEADEYQKISTNETVKTYVDNHTETDLVDGVHGAKLVEDLSEEADEYQKISTNETIKTYVDNAESNAIQHSDNTSLQKSENLNDLEDAEEARNNLSLGTASQSDIGLDENEIPTNDMLEDSLGIETGTATIELKDDEDELISSQSISYRKEGNLVTIPAFTISGNDISSDNGVLKISGFPYTVSQEPYVPLILFGYDDASDVIMWYLRIEIGTSEGSISKVTSSAELDENVSGEDFKDGGPQVTKRISVSSFVYATSE